MKEISTPREGTEEGRACPHWPAKARLIGIYLPNLYTKVFGGKYVPTRAPEIEFVKTCLALMGENPANDESYIQDCFKLAGKRRRKFCS